VTVSDSNNMVAEDNGTVEIFGRAPATKTPTKTFTVINGLQGGTFYGTLEQFVFLYTAYDGKVEQYDPQTYAFIQDFSAPPGAGQIYDGGSQVFVVNDVTNQLTDIDPRVSKLQFTTKVGNSPGGVSADGNTVYVANRGDDTVSAVSEYTGKVTQTFKLAAGAHPEDVAAEYAQVAATPTPSPAPTATPTATPSPTPTPSSTPGATQHLYVANGSGGNVLEYTSPFSTSSTPAVNLNIGGSVYGVASDSSYVAIEDSNGFMYIFAQPLSASASPVASFQAGRAGAQLYFDSHGNLFTGDEGAEVLEYSPPFNNTSTPAKIINGTTASFSLAMDYNNNLYAGDLGLNQIEVFAAPYSAAPTTVGQPGTYGLASYATYLYGADAGSGKIDVYNLPLSASSTPAFTIPNTDPHALAADISTGTLYVGDQHGGSGSGSIDVYNQPLSGSSTPAFSITSGVKEPVQVWIGP
jgi:YVTN family beta-propeller protein